MYYYTASGNYNSYRRIKTIIDFIIVLMAVLITALFVALIFWQSKRDILFTAIFMSGTIANGASSIKNFLTDNKKAGIILGIITILLLLLTFACWNTMVR